MKRNLAIVLAALIAALAGLLVPSAASGAPSSLPAAAYQHNVCGPPANGSARCHAKVVDVDGGGPGRAPTPKVSSSPTGLTPANIQTAYGFPTSGAAGKTIAIVDAYDNPTAIADLDTFDAAFGRPPCGCITKVDQNGGTAYPAFNSGWALEIALDVQWAHAVAPDAQILLVEANSNSYADLFAAVDYAKAHAQYVSMSWGSSEWSGETAWDSRFTPGVSYFVSAGDNGTPAEYPSSSPNVLSIGGTKLTFTDSTKSALLSETAWSGGGGGCSAYETKTSAQTYPPNLCTNGKRATPDISLDADPASGVSVYMGSPYQGQTGWFTVGGTSASAPMIAGRAALTGGLVDSAFIYNTLAATSVRDITVGNNGAACLTGFDLCSGRGSWADNATTVPAPTTTTTTAPTTTTTTAPTTTTTTAAPTTTTTAAPTKVHAGSITYALTPNRKGFTVTVTIRRDSDNAAVSGANVSVTIKKGSSNYASGSGTTGSNGSVTFRVNSASSGTYSTVINSVTGNNLSWDGVTPPNSFTK